MKPLTGLLAQKVNTYLVIHIFAVDLWLDNVHEWIHQSRAFPQLSPGLATFWAHIPWGERKGINIIVCFFEKKNLPFSLNFLRCSKHDSLVYLRQPAVLVKAVSHSIWRGLQLSSPPLLPWSQPEWGTITSSASACSAWSTISIFTESWDERFHNVPGTIEKIFLPSKQISLNIQSHYG